MFIRMIYLYIYICSEFRRTTSSLFSHNYNFYEVRVIKIYVSFKYDLHRPVFQKNNLGVSLTL